MPNFLWVLLGLPIAVIAIYAYAAYRDVRAQNLEDEQSFDPWED